tara:strand:+ start:333 stop:605 length:273 start_codon:yes stop_codon:yes gene_type:complete
MLFLFFKITVYMNININIISSSMKKFNLKSLGFGFTFIFVIIMSFLLVKPEKVEAFDGGCPYWAMADRYDRYPCAGNPRDCLVLCVIVVE